MCLQGCLSLSLSLSCTMHSANNQLFYHPAEQIISSYCFLVILCHHRMNTVVPGSYIYIQTVILSLSHSKSYFHIYKNAPGHLFIKKVSFLIFSSDPGPRFFVVCFFSLLKVRKQIQESKQSSTNQVPQLTQDTIQTSGNSNICNKINNKVINNKK